MFALTNTAHSVVWFSGCGPAGFCSVGFSQTAARKTRTFGRKSGFFTLPLHSPLPRCIVLVGIIKLQLAIARLRLHASMVSICLSVCPSVCLSPKCKKTRFSQKLSNLELRCLLTTYRKLCKLNLAFQRTHYWIPTIQDGRDTPS